ncbi:unnamed protein product [Rotaria sp. Silwood2]|nr:unnamed protein product [Rotaria sp. Silwood2]CAF2512059.1 unnamed protein product [Rotaria sp. Silwood2]CAF2745776.1 unnamed protein product [Rotaria sp. Silwood2]CAF3867144.1 unnamed protein product [Rotaria sp. Silwood2]CAF3902404.1 unnamed protein product [Rotaria sp. Silwood2]
MAVNDGVFNVAKILALLSNEEEFILKPFQNGFANEIGAIECGKIVSRVNKVLFNYQIGDKTNPSVLNSILSQRIILMMPETKQVVLELYQNRLPLPCQMCTKQEVRCLPTISSESQSIGSIRRGYV